jgi:MFS family permease
MSDIAVMTAPALNRNRDFLLWWGGSMISGLGTGISGIAWPLLVLGATGSASKAALIGSCFGFSYALCALPSGVLADRYPRKMVLVFTSLVELAALAAVTTSLLAGFFWLPLLLGVAVVQAAMDSLRSAAGRPALRRIVPQTQIDQALSRTLAGGNVVEIVAPVCGGLLYTAARWLPFAADSLSFAATAFSALLVRTPLGPETRARQRFRTELGEGLRYVWSNAYLRFVAWWTAVVSAAATMVPLAIVVLLQSRGAKPWLIGVVSAIAAVGGVLGAAASNRLIARFARRRLVLAASWGLAVSVAVVAVLPYPLLIAAAFGASAFLFAPLVVVINAYELRVVPDELQARVQTIMTMAELSLPWAVLLAAGVVIDRMGPAAAVLVAAVIYAVAAVIAGNAKSLHALDSEAEGEGEIR